eukprot:TRINITY_DN4795_c0_g1_i1.p1 TRINITY_DN4795_c0_g1~~TRINITY_DN4795_c0_g1_i1.p1  ORF type:complete len:933 (-),score=211.82 TRINITY_DN4795_c0_g1_i1:60-2828(-)
MEGRGKAKKKKSRGVKKDVKQKGKEKVNEEENVEEEVEKVIEVEKVHNEEVEKVEGNKPTLETNEVKLEEDEMEGRGKAKKKKSRGVKKDVKQKGKEKVNEEENVEEEVEKVIEVEKVHNEEVEKVEGNKPTLETNEVKLEVKKVLGNIQTRIGQLEDWVGNNIVIETNEESEEVNLESKELIQNRILPFLPTLESLQQDLQHNSQHFKRNESIYVPSFIIIFLVSFAVFLNGLNGALVFDDAVAIGKNPDIRPEQTGWASMWFNDYWGNPINTPGVWTCKSYRPLTVLSFRINYMIHNVSTFGYHLGNVIFHCLVTYLFYLIGQVIFAQYKESKRRTISFIAALVFAIHPIHTDAVDSIVGRAEVMYAMFFCLSFLLYTKASRADGTNWVSLFGSMMCYAASCLCKEMGIMVLGLNIGWDLLYNYDFVAVGSDLITTLASYFDKKSNKTLAQVAKKAGSLISRNWVHFIVRLSVMLFCAFLYLLHRSIYVGGLAGINMQKHHNPIAFSEGWDKWRTIFYLHYLYAYLLFMPLYLSADYSMSCIPMVTSWWNVANICSLSFYVALFGIIGYAIKERGKFQKATLLVLGWYLVPFLPASQIFFSPGTVLAERVLYVPSSSFCFFVGWVLYSIFKHELNNTAVKKSNKSKKGRSIRGKSWKKVVLYGLILSVGTFYIAKTVYQNNVWYSQYDLFKNAANTCPTSGKSLYNLGAQLESRGKEQDALNLYLKAAQIDPSYTNALGRIGKIYLKRGQMEDSISYFNRIVTIKFNDGSLLHHDFAYHDTAFAHWQVKNYTAAERFFKIASRINPEADARYPVDAEMNLGCMYLELGYFDAALEHLNNANRMRPNDSFINTNLGVLFWRMNKTQESVEYFKKGYELSSGEARSIAHQNWETISTLINNRGAPTHGSRTLDLRYSTIIRP